MLNYFQILILALVQGACELLPVSSSAHVIVAEKLMGLDPSSPEMTMLLVMLHTGTMFAVIVYFWRGWKRDYFASTGQLQWFAIQVIVATFATGVVGYGLKVLIEKIFMRGVAARRDRGFVFEPAPDRRRARRRRRVDHLRRAARGKNTAPLGNPAGRTRFGSALCRESACPFAAFRVPARPFPPDCCSACPGRNWRNSVSRWRWC